ncbi:MAG: alpha/beta fold hydrolase [Caldilineaceae bacterium]|nr:alpha/beta fold hydrolase [Caldilineaceae bacterium]
MNRRRLFLFIPILLVVLFAFGPRVALDTTLRPVQLPADLDSYLATEEARFIDLKPDTAKTIIWADPAQKAPTAVAIVSIHGFSATRHETAPLSDRVAEQLGGNLYYARLTGHGRSDDAMGEATVNAWLNDTMEAVTIGEALGDDVVLIASSTGASLLTWLAANDKLDDDVAALVFLSPNFGPANTMAELLLWPWGLEIAQLVEGRYRSWEPLNEQHGYYWTHRYPVGALLPMMGAVKLAREADLSKVHQPLLILNSAEDIVVSPEKTAYYFEQFGSTTKTRIVVKTDHPWGHVLAGDVLSPRTTEPLAQTIVDWLIPVLDAPAGQ